MGKSFHVAAAMVLFSFALSAYFLPLMPEFMVSHWDAEGIANGAMPKFWALFLMPLISLGLLALFWAIPHIDPLKRNVQSFRNYFDNFVLLIFAFLLYIHALSLGWNLGYKFNFVVAIVPALGLLFYYVGVLLEHAKQNWFIGIRTPWTMSNEAVWNKTHRLGAGLFKGCALISILGLAFRPYAIWFVLVPVIASAVYLVVYSYVEFKKINR